MRNHIAQWAELSGVVLCALATVSTATENPNVTFTKDVAPILHKHCVECHRPGEIGPFPLLDYKDARKRAEHIKEITASRRMPPWLPEPGPLHFLGERRLTDKELDTLARWADSGAPEGDPNDLPPPPKFAQGWRLGQPDHILEMASEFTVPAEGRDLYEAFLVKMPTQEPTWIRGFEFRPGNARVVHHATLYIDPTGMMRKRVTEPGGDRVTISGPPDPATLQGLRLIAGWQPGNTPRYLPEECPVLIPPNSDLVIQIHYHPTGKVEKDRSKVGLFVSPVPAKRQQLYLPLAVGYPFKNTDLLNIPAGARRHKAELSRTLPDDAVVLAVAPHAHYILKEVSITAALPDGRSLSLLDIRNWDFNRQDRYYFEKPPKLPKGTKLHLMGVFDNSAENPQNPSRPPRDVTFGPRTTDEMLSMVVAVLPDGEKATQTYREMIREKGMTPWSNGADAAAAETSDYKIPAGGLPIPPGASRLNEQFDKNKDGLLSQDEFDAIPRPLQQQLEVILQRRPRTNAATPELAAALTLAVAPMPRAVEAEQQVVPDAAVASLTINARTQPEKEKVQPQPEKGLPRPEKDPPQPGKAPPSSTAPAEALKLPAGGLQIPEAAMKLRDKFDANKDGKLSQEEFDAIPEPVRAEVAKVLREKLGPRLSSPAKDPSPAPVPAAKAKTGDFRLPPGGVTLPESALMVRGKYDTNKDGKLTQEEFDAIPQDVRQQVETFLRQRPTEKPTPKR